MMRQLVLLCLAAGLLLSALPALAASAKEIPNRKAGPWETAGSPLPAMIVQLCTDETTDSATRLVAKWGGVCKADLKAGNIGMWGGFKTNVKDMGVPKDRTLTFRCFGGTSF